MANRIFPTADVSGATVVRAINTAMICGLLMTVIDPAVMFYYAGGWFLIVIAMRGD